MADLRLHVPAQVFFGTDSTHRLGAVASELGRRVLLVTEAILYERGTVDAVTGVLGRRNLDPIVFDEVVPNATSTAVEEAVRLGRGGHVDLVVGLGGLSALSIAKATAMLVRARTSVDDMLSGTPADARPLPLIEIPTTCRDPFMFGGGYLLVDARDRRAHLGKGAEDPTRIVLIDPRLSLSLPAKYTATTMMDTLLHAVEGYLSTASSFLSETLFLQAVRIIGRTLTGAIDAPDELKPRLEASKAGLLTALGLSVSRSGIGSALSYALNGRLRVPKSWVSTILLPHVMEFNLNVSSEKLRDVGDALGGGAEGAPTVEAAGRAVETVRSLIASLQLPSRLRDFDLNLEDMMEVAEIAHGFDLMNQLPRVASTDDLYEILKTAY